MLIMKPGSPDLTKWVNILLGLLAVFLGALHTWAAVSNFSMNADGISYLDIGDAYWRGDWQNAINPVWSPLYSWVLGAAMYVFRPSLRWEFPLVQVVNFLIYLWAFASFKIFWRQVWNYLQTRPGSETGLPGWAFQALGSLLFIWTSLTLIEIWSVTPDMLMAAIIYLAAALTLRMRLEVQSWSVYALLGLVLGLGYLSKTIMLPVALLFMGVGFLSAGGVRRLAPRAALSLVVFLAVAGPFIVLISRAKGYFTYGESGQITYMRYMNGIPYPHWQGDPPGSGTPVHPSRKIFSIPAIYEFASPIGGTYPISYDPSYWYEGVQLHFDLRETVPAILKNGLVYFDLFLQELGPLVGISLLLYLLARRKRLPMIRQLRSWNLAILALLVFGLYALVYVEGRYIGVFIVILWADLLMNLSLPENEPNQRLLAAAGALMIACLFGNLVAFNLEGLGSLVTNPAQQPKPNHTAPAPSWPGEVAEVLIRAGIEPGAAVGVIGYAFDSYWARLARVKIVAEMYEWEAEPFYLGDPAFQTEVIQAFASTGACAIIAEHVPGYASLDGWRQVGKTNYYYYLLDQ